MRTRSAIFREAAAQWRAMRADFELVLESTYAKAERDTNGVMLNRDGRREPITAWSLLTGPWSRVAKYGSPELIEWFGVNGRPSLEDFEREWWRGRNEGPEPELGPAPGGNPDAIAAAGRKIEEARRLADAAVPHCTVVGCWSLATHTIEGPSEAVAEVCASHFTAWHEANPGTITMPLRAEWPV